MRERHVFHKVLLLMSFLEFPLCFAFPAALLSVVGLFDRSKDATSYRLIEALVGWWDQYFGSPKYHPFLWAFSILNHPEMGGTPIYGKKT